MREILFRGKQIDNNEWVYGYYVPACFGRFPCRPAIVPEPNGEWRPIEVKPETVGQFAGLTDKNGNKIFGGDIIKVPDCCHRGDAIGFVYYDCDETAYCAKCWGIKYQLGADLSSDSIEIIGNTYDNSELLELTESR